MEVPTLTFATRSSLCTGRVGTFRKNPCRIAVFQPKRNSQAFSTLLQPNVRDNNSFTTNKQQFSKTPFATISSLQKKNAIHVHFDDSTTSLFHAPWLWSNDPAHVHATSGQRTRSVASYYLYGWTIVDVTIVVDNDAVVPPPGCLHPVGSVYQLNNDSNKNDANEPRIQSSETTTEALQVTWQNATDQQITSRYDLDWLYQCQYDVTALAELKLQTQIATADICKDFALEQVDFQALSRLETRDRALEQLLRAVLDTGAAIVNDAPINNENEDGAVLDLAQWMAGGTSHNHLYGSTFHVRGVPDAHNVAYTNAALAPHQDLAYYESSPGFQLLHCIVPSTCNSGDGASTLIDAVAAARAFSKLAPDLFRVLTETPATFVKQRRDADMCYRAPHICLSGDTSSISRVRWSPPFMGPLCADASIVENYYVAYAAFELLVDTEIPVNENHPMEAIGAQLEKELRDYAMQHTWEYQLRPGQVLVFNNQRMLHGRRGFTQQNISGGANRHLIGCYTNMEETLNTYRLLRRKRYKSRKHVLYQRDVGNGSIGVK
jgi:alpha-ketoglutarate-dependent taurine dioxygenase